MTPRDAIDALKGTSSQQRSAAMGCIGGWRKKALPITRPRALPATVQSTSAQWAWAVFDGHIDTRWHELDASVNRIVSIVCQPAASIGRLLFGVVEELIEAYDALQSAVFEVGRFVPPAGQLTEALDLLTTMQQIALGVVENVIICLSNQLDIIMTVGHRVA
ncbi:hypothetical protein ACSVDM_06005 [Nocardia sp. JW2]|uniref:hypothetical protein n=1 Tax=Nocardia sp. JW2 TaxID=3450738 RepID=UPI003F43F36C